MAGLKIDVLKAYDRLEWRFIEGMLEKFKFHHVWIQRIMTCIKTVSYSFLHQGEVFGELMPQKGIRQGDPISPYIYILCAEGLSSIIKRHEEMGLIHGIKIARRAPSVSHLLFADDCYFFFKAVETEAHVMNRIIKRYEDLSGQSVNFSKSLITFSPNTSPAIRGQICGILEVRESEAPGKYLGLPMAVGRKKNEVFNFLSDRVNQKLKGWQNKSISKAGKCILLKTAAQAIPNFVTGMDTFVWKIPWLPCTVNGYISTHMPVELENTRVSDLMVEQERKWDDDILHDLFEDRDIQLIKKIPLSTRSFNDTWMWIFEEKREFTVKSCYRRLVGEFDMLDADFWKKLWKLDLPEKICFFLWRTCRQCLPTATELVKKRVNIDSRCGWCQVGSEDAKHVLFECMFAQNVWRTANMTQLVHTTQGETIFDHFKRLFSTGTNEQCTSVALFCWSIWNRRNNWVWKRVDGSVFGTMNAALNLLRDWKTAQVERTKAATASNGNEKRWQAPRSSWIKINVDAAIFADI